jgi:hypothetical protein
MTSEPDYRQLRPHLGWLPIDAIKKMFEHTTQLARMPMSTILKKWYKSLNPALNVRPRDEPVATDTIYSDTPRSIVALPLLSFLLVLRPILQMCTLSSLINSLSIRFWTTSPNAVHLPNSSATMHGLRLVNMSSRFFDPYTFPLGRARHINSIRTLPNASTRTSNDCATPSLTALGPRHTLGFFVPCMCVSCSTTHSVKWLMIFLFACPQVLLTTSVPYYVFTSGNLSTTSLTTVTSI